MLCLLTQLPDRLKSVFDQCAAAHDDARLAFHSDPERMAMTVRAEAVLVQDRAGDERRAVARADRSRTDPFEVPGGSSIALIRKRLKKQPNLLPRSEPGQALLPHQQPRSCI